MSKELEAFEDLKRQVGNMPYTSYDNGLGNRSTFLIKDSAIFPLIENALKDYENLKDENKLLRENVEHLDETYFDTWCACERLKKNTNYALMFVDNTYCLVDTKDNKFDVIDNYKINNKGIIDNETLEKFIALEIIKEKEVNVGNFKASLLLTYEQYQEALDNDWTIVKQISKTPLTQEEYDLLKEVLL